MKLKIHPRVVANFFLDGAKIIFGSFVIGMFVPGVKAIEFPYSTFAFGILLTIVFFVAANIAAHGEDAITLNQRSHRGRISSSMMRRGEGFVV